MYSWEEGPYTDDIHEWESKMEEEYNQYLEETCTCTEDCECMSFSKFIDKALEDVADRYDSYEEDGIYA